MNKRTVIDQALCDHVRILLAGGANQQQAAEIVGVGESTITRIKRAEFNAEVYQRNTEKRRKGAEEKAEQPEEAQVPGQLTMPLEKLVIHGQQEENDLNRMMRFQAAQVEKICMKLEKLNDTLNMLVRAIRKE